MTSGGRLVDRLAGGLGVEAEAADDQRDLRLAVGGERPGVGLGRRAAVGADHRQQAAGPWHEQAGDRRLAAGPRRRRLRRRRAGVAGNGDDRLRRRWASASAISVRRAAESCTVAAPNGASPAVSLGSASRQPGGALVSAMWASDRRTTGAPAFGLPVSDTSAAAQATKKPARGRRPDHRIGERAQRRSAQRRRPPAAVADGVLANVARGLSDATASCVDG